MKQIDRIRNMNAEELASFLEKTSKCEFLHCEDCPYGKAITVDDDVVETYCCASDITNIKEWLLSEVEE